MEDIKLRELLYNSRRHPLFVLFYLILSILVFSNNDNFHIEKIYAHLFTPNETATFVSIVYQLQAELELVSKPCKQSIFAPESKDVGRNSGG